jgi:hypothetical protein
MTRLSATEATSHAEVSTLSTVNPPNLLTQRPGSYRDDDKRSIVAGEAAVYNYLVISPRFERYARKILLLNF